MANIDEKAGISEIGTTWNKHGTLPAHRCVFLSFFGGSSSSYGGTVLSGCFLDGLDIFMVSPPQALPSSAALPLTDDLARASLGLIFTRRLFPSDLVCRMCLSYLMLRSSCVWGDWKLSCINSRF